MARVSNFMAGPAGLPLPVLEKAQAALLDYEGSGMSIMENSHRSKTFETVHNAALGLMKELLGVPDGYKTLFLQGGASGQFAIIPMNFLPAGRSADYILTGHWSERALAEAQIVGKARVAGSTAELKYTRVPTDGELSLDPHAAYVHLTTNNTIYGTEWHRLPSFGDVPLIADASSDILSRKTDVSKFAMLYAGAQKNIGPSGVVVVIIKESLVEAGRKDIPVIFQYGTHAKNNSLYHTPPSFGIYLLKEMLSWVKSVGGLAQVEAWNAEKARLLYAAIDGRADLYHCPVDAGSRSLMNVVFRLPSEALDNRFVVEAEKAGMVGLKGYRTMGGVRASLYNAVTVADVQKLVDFMAAFQP